MNLTVGTVLQDGKYVLEDPLGQSELSITYKATQAHLKQIVVLKTLNRRPEADVSHLRKPFLEEARRFARCQHPGLVRILDLFEQDGLPFVVMDYLLGQSLPELVKMRGPLPEAQALQYIRQVGSALSALHRNGLVHKDVKPENLIHPKGADFVVLVGFDLLTSKSIAAKPTTINPYAPSEYYSLQEPLTPASDIYALSATLYFLLTGQPPVAAPLRNHAALIAPRQLQPSLSAVVESAILAGLAMDAQSRPQSIAAWFGLLPDSKPAQHDAGNGAGHTPTMIELPKAPTNTNGSIAASHPPTQATKAVVAPAPKVELSQVSRPKSRLPKILVMTSALAVSVGLGLGLALRLSAASGIGPRIFHTKQFFPPVEGWPGIAEPVTAPVVSPTPESAVKQQPELAPPPRPPVIPRPAPSVDASPAPEPSVEASPALPEPSPPSEPVAPMPAPDIAPPTSAPAPVPLAPSPEAAPVPKLERPNSEGTKSDGVL